MKILGEILRKFPKVDLHCHIDGSIRVETIFDIMKGKTDLPCDNPKDLAKYVHVSSDCRSLTDFLSKFEFFYPYLKDPAVMERITYELAEDAAKENIRYFEARFAPCLQKSGQYSQEDILKGVLRGAERATSHFGVKVGVILCVYRGTALEEWEETVSLAERYFGKGVVGIDLAGDESKYSARPFKQIFGRARSRGIHITVHAGEAWNWNSVREAVDLLHAERIGHGIKISENDVFFERIKQLQKPLEICVTSNVHTGAVRSYDEHPLREFYRRGIRTTINTDDRGVSNIDLTHEWRIAQEKCGLELEDVLDMNMNSCEAAFLPPGEKTALKEEIQKETRGLMSEIEKNKK
ncbi:MAG: adenosine deaminase [Elusimicrobia bacterium]|nr:adenosine deaminase [Elusimicrobiota bacterium]